MQIFKIYSLLSCLVGAMQIADGVVLTSATSVPHKIAALFGFYGICGAFGLVELTWLAASVLAGAYAIKRGYSFVPPVCYVIFCLLHPVVGMLIPAAAFSNDPNAALARVAPAVIDIVFGILYIGLNASFYRHLFFVPKLFDK